MPPLRCGSLGASGTEDSSAHPAPDRAELHSTGTTRSQQNAFYSTRWCSGLSYGCCLMAWARMPSRLGLEVAGHHARLSMGLKPSGFCSSPSPTSSETPRPLPSFARQKHPWSPSSLEHHCGPSDLGCDAMWEIQGPVAQLRLPAALWPLLL